MSRFILILTFVGALPAPAAAADTKFDLDAVARAVAHYLDDRTLVVGHLDLSRLDADEFLSSFARLTGMDDKETTAARQAVKQTLEAFRQAGGKDAYFVFSLVDLLEAPFFIFPAGEGGDVKALTQAVRDMKLLAPKSETQRLGNVVFTGTRSTLDRLTKLRPTPRPDLLEALKGTRETTVAQLTLLPTTDARRILEETLPNLPPEVGGGPIKAFTHGIRWAVLAAETSPKLTLRLTVQTPDAKAAMELNDALAKVYKAVGFQKEVREMLPDWGKLVELFTPTVAGDQVTLVLEEKALLPIVRPAVVKVRTRTAQAKSASNLKQLGLALHNYHDAYGRFPAAALYDKDKKKPLLSWRVQLLPFLQQEQLYRQFKLDEPWDSEHNLKLLPLMPKVYQASSDARLVDAHQTTFLAPLAKATMFPPGSDGVRIVEVTDGTSNTLFVVDADDDHAVLWTKPDDLEVSEDNPAKALSIRHGGYAALFVDGSVRILSKDIAKQALWALFTRNGGEVIGDMP